MKLAQKFISGKKDEQERVAKGRLEMDLSSRLKNGMCLIFLSLVSSVF